MLNQEYRLLQTGITELVIHDVTGSPPPYIYINLTIYTRKHSFRRARGKRHGSPLHFVCIGQDVRVKTIDSED